MDHSGIIYSVVCEEILNKPLQRFKIQLPVPCSDCSNEQYHLHYHLHVASEHVELRILAFLFLKVLHFPEQINGLHDFYHFCSSFFDLFLGFVFTSITQLLCAILDFNACSQTIFSNFFRDIEFPIFFQQI